MEFPVHLKLKGISKFVVIVLNKFERNFFYIQKGRSSIAGLSVLSSFCRSVLIFCGWRPTFWVLRSLDNNLLFTVGIDVYVCI